MIDCPKNDKIIDCPGKKWKDDRLSEMKNIRYAKISDFIIDLQFVVLSFENLFDFGLSNMISLLDSSNIISFSN